MKATRTDGRGFHELRPITITRNFLKNPEGSVLIEMGETKVICTVLVEEKVPNWMKNAGVTGGWVTAEYGMIPGSTNTRIGREKSRTGGRTMEIQRLIGRSLRAAVNLEKLGERTLWIDCDVIAADGGTRTAAITGAFTALSDALNKLTQKGLLKTSPIKNSVAAVSVGIVGGKLLLDLNYEEDSQAEVDMNLVMTDKGEFIEVQATGERGTIGVKKLQEMLDIGASGIRKLLEIQQRSLQKLKVKKSK